MSKVLLDTDILSEYLKDHDKNVAKHGDAYADEHSYFTFTSVTVYEIMFGLHAKGAERQLASTLTWLNKNEQILPIDEDFLTPARIKGAARRMGLTVELPDCLIAAVAARLNLPLVTGNTADFESIRSTGLNLLLQDWRLPLV